MRARILVTQRDAWGNTLCVYRHDRAYQVGTVSSHGRPVPLAQAQFWTYEAALTRLQEETRQRQAGYAQAMTTEEHKEERPRDRDPRRHP